MIADEIKKLAEQSRNTNEDFNKQWNEMQERIKQTAMQGMNYCIMVYGKYNEQLIEKLKENGFKVMRKMELFPHIPYGARNCMTHYVVW